MRKLRKNQETSSLQPSASLTPFWTYNSKNELPQQSEGAGMTIDERLLRLTERHEALTGHVEILTQDVAQLTNDVRTMRSTMNDLMNGFTTLVELVRSHEYRIERLEGR
jgi:hypothetical protein